MPVKRQLPSNQLPLRTSDTFQLMQSRPWPLLKAAQYLPGTPLPMHQSRYPYRVFYLQPQQDWTNRWISVPLPCLSPPFIGFKFYVKIWNEHLLELRFRQLHELQTFPSLDGQCYQVRPSATFRCRANFSSLTSYTN